MVAMDGCACGRSKRVNQWLCGECSGASTRKSIRMRLDNLSACLYAAAVEEMRVRLAVARSKERL